MNLQQLITNPLKHTFKRPKNTKERLLMVGGVCLAAGSGYLLYRYIKNRLQTLPDFYSDEQLLEATKQLKKELFVVCLYTKSLVDVVKDEMKRRGRNFESWIAKKRDERIRERDVLGGGEAFFLYSQEYLSAQAKSVRQKMDGGKGGLTGLRGLENIDEGRLVLPFELPDYFF